jgi:hypothetical protein
MCVDEHTSATQLPSYPLTFRSIARSHFCGQPWPVRIPDCKFSKNGRVNATILETLPRFGGNARCTFAGFRLPNQPVRFFSSAGYTP